jgi:hypothetical protein
VHGWVNIACLSSVGENRKEFLEGLNGQFVKMLGIHRLGCLSQICCRCNAKVLWGKGWVHQVFVPEKCHSQDVSCTSVSQPEIPALIIFGGGLWDKCFSAVFSEGLLFLRLMVDKCLHANGHKWMLVIVVMAMEVCICQ